MQIFEEIQVGQYLSGKDSFTSDDGSINEQMPVATWKTTFQETEIGTVVMTDARYPGTESIEEVLKMGIAEGMSMAQDTLEKLLHELKSTSAPRK